MLPEKRGIEPSYEEKRFDDNDKRGRLRLIVSPGGKDGSLLIHQDVRVYASLLEAGEEVQHDIARDRHAWVQVVRGRITVNGQALGRGDGAAVSEEPLLKFKGLDTAEFLLFDLMGGGSQ